MGKFDNYNLSINDKLPEYWNQDIFLKPIERFSSILIRDAVQRFMEKIGVLQPFMLWKTLPEEYDWEYGFEDYDLRLANNEENENCDQTLQLSEDNHIVAQLPLTKRNVHAYIVLELSSLSFSDSTEFMPIKELVIKNANQTLKIKDIDSKTTIEINTKDNTILLNDEEPKANQIEGSIDIIKRSPRDDPSTITDPLDINEVCELDIYLSNGELAYCDLYVQLFNPVYVTEQNIRIHSLSAFPLEYVRLYGYMCHQFNNKHQWVYLWEKTYAYQDRIVYDKIAKQYDCEIFYAEIKIYGLPAPIYIGFPATLEDSVEGIFTLNSNLDYWGDVFHMPRRHYKTDIQEEQERYCFPKYYNYPIEQDYPYEQRLINEYKYNEDWQDYINITDTDGTDLALVKCKDPYMDNIYMYTETITPTDILNSKTSLYPNCIKEINHNDVSLQQAVWETPSNLRYDSKSYSIATLNKQDEENITNQSYKSNILTLEYDLSSLPENCKIKGMELKFKGVSNTHSDNIYIDERSFLKYTKKVLNNETGNHSWQTQDVPLSNYFETWSPDNNFYILGDKDSIFGINEVIDKDSIEKGYLRDGVFQSNKIRFDIGFSNNSNVLDLIIKLFSIQLTIYFDLIKEDIDLQVDIPNKIIIYDNEQSSAIDLNLTFINQGEIKEIDYNSFIILPPELCFTEDINDTEKKTIKEFNLGNVSELDYITEDSNHNILHIGEQWKYNIQISANNNPLFKTGRYDIVIICGKEIYTEEVFIYDKDYAIYNNYISYNTDDTNIELSFVENYVEAEFGSANITVKLTKNNAPYPYQYIYLKDTNGNMNYRILDENGEASFVYTVQDDTQINAYYSNLNAICHIKYVLGECLKLTYDTKINKTVSLGNFIRDSSSLNVDWGDGTKYSFGDSSTHTYEDQQLYTIKIWGEELSVIPSGAFSQHNHLINVNAPSIIEVGDGAFYACSSLEKINLPNATAIGTAVFSNCSSLEEISLPETTTIGTGVFSGCSSLEEISLPKTTTIGANAFTNCSNLKRATLSQLQVLPSGAFNVCIDLEEVSLPQATTIQSGAFAQCSSLQIINLPNATTIQSGAFSNCSNLQQAILPQLKIVPQYLFAGFSNLTEIYLENVELIQKGAFQGTNIQEITLPATLTQIARDAFLHNKDAYPNTFATITFKSAVPPALIENKPLILNNRTILHIPCGTKDAYKNNTYYPNDDNKYIEDCE